VVSEPGGPPPAPGMRPILCIVGTRPNYMKMAPILAAFDGHRPPIPYRFVHTGQHYDSAMEKVFFDALGLPEPHANLAVGGGSHAVQTARIMERLDAVVDALQPGSMLVVGDVNSTLGAALVAAKRNLPLIHVEAGLRSGDRTMPEEVNRILTDAVSDLLFTTERGAHDNLAREGVAADRIVFVGNVMIDTLERHRDRFVGAEATLAAAGCAAPRRWLAEGFALVTLHRPSNVDSRQALAPLIDVLNEIGRDLPLVFPVHPRTRNNLQTFGLQQGMPADRWLLLEPLPYFDMLGLMRDAALVLTDSGGVQEESTVLGVPCLTLRENTERPVTVTQGTNRLVGTQPSAIRDAYDALKKAGLRNTRGGTPKRPEGWDGKAAERIAEAVWTRRERLLPTG
jgi:UDP-N-acetylglucosamine 2-epimerase (non-hydrolysing)